MARADELVGRTLAERYRLLAHIGKGGMADVYRAEDRSEHRTVALKLLRSRRPDFEARLRREYQILTSLAHPRVVQVHELGTGTHGPFYTMELLEHGDLRSVERPVDLERACELLRQVAVALTFLHARQFVHRDVTPGNIRFAADGRLKLIDFGVMITAGSVPEDIAGTPAFLAPESLRGGPVDHRADLFALGALGYWLLTGEHAYATDTLEGLASTWAAGPPSLRTVRPDLPEELDDLIRSLLRPDRDARPGNAVEVIGRLTGLGDLVPVAADEVARSFISSAAVVGREDEVARLCALVQEVREGAGAAAALVGRAGSGKSRLLLELRVAAEVAGVPVVRLDGGAAGPGFLDALIGAVERVRPRCSELRSHAALAEARHGARDQSEDALAHQLAVQDAIAGWLSELAQRQPFVVSLDDGQQLSAYSLGIVSAIVRASNTSAILVVVGYRDDEDTDDLRQLELALREGITMRLRGVSVEAVEALVESTVGRVPVGMRLAKWLHAGTGGNPLLCIETLRALIDDGGLRFADGVWSIDIDLHERAPPAGLREQTEERIAGLSPNARDLGSSLAVYRPDFGLDEVSLVSDATDPFAAVGQLVRAGLLVGGPLRFSFVRRDVRQCFIERLAPEDRRRLDRRAAMLLETRADATPLELGWHWLRGGDPRRGAALLEAEARRLHGEQLLSECVAPLEAALTVYETIPSEQGRTLELRILILDAGIMVDRSAFLEHVDRARADAWRQSGFEVAEKLRRRLGARASMVVGVASAFAVWLATRRSRGRLRPDRALVHALASLVYGGSFSKNLDDASRLDRIMEASKVLDGFRGLTPYAAALMVRSYVHASRGEWTEMERVNTEALELLERDTLLGLTDRERAMARGEILNNLAVVPLVRSDPSFGRAVARADTRGIIAFSVAAEALQVCSLRLHGRESEARRLELGLESRIARLGSLWIFEGLLLEQSAYAFAHYGDLGGLRRTRGSLQQQFDKGVRGPHVLQLATAACDALVGRHAAAADSLSDLWASLPRPSERRLPTAVALGRSLVWLRRFDRLDALLDEALALARDETCGNPLYAGHLLRIEAAARREQGKLDEAEQRLDEAAAIARRLECVGLQALVCETRARLALSREDSLAAAESLAQMEALARSAGNAVLMQRQQELADKVQDAQASAPSRSAASVEQTAVITRARTTLRSGPDQEWTRALIDDIAHWILGELDCVEAHLLSPADRGGELVASAPGDAPPPRMVGELARLLDGDGKGTTVVADADVDADADPHAPRVHRLHGGPEGALLGYLVTVGARRPFAQAVLDEIGRRLGDVYE